MSSYPRQQLERWLGNIDIEKGAKVLDVGGSQYPVLGRTKGYVKDIGEYDILDLENPHKCRAFPDLVVDIQDEILFDHILERFREHYDVAFCLEVSEYWYDPVTAVKNIASFLKPGGTLYISFHFLYPVHEPLSEDCLRYTRKGAEKILENAGFRTANVVVKKLRSPEFYRGLIDIEAMRGMKGIETTEQGFLFEAVKI